MSTGPFATTTSVEATGDATFHGSIAPRWDIAGNANGGLLLAIRARALVAATGRPDPVTITAHYLSPAKPRPVDVTTEVVKAGKRFTTGAALMRSGDRPLLSLLETFGDLTEDAASLLVDGSPPDLPPVEDCLHLPSSATIPPPFNAQVELHIHPEDASYASKERSGIARVHGWFRLPHGEAVDKVGLLLTLDSFPPTVFNSDLPVGWTPTIELTAHVRARPVPGWLRCRFTTRFVSGGFLEEDGEIWDGDGRLVAQSRQLALVPRG